MRQIKISNQDLGTLISEGELMACVRNREQFM